MAGRSSLTRNSEVESGIEFPKHRAGKGKLHKFRNRHEQHKGRFVFKSYTVYLYALLFSTMETLCLSRAFTNIRTYQGIAFFFPMTITFIFLALPLMLSQIFLGQYAKVGALKLWRLSPIASGIGYTMVIVSVVRLIGKGRLSTISFVHVILAMQTTIPWATCDFITDGRQCVSPTNTNTSFDYGNKCCKTRLNDFSMCPKGQRVFLPFSSRLWHEEKLFNKDFDIEKDGLGDFHPYVTSFLIFTWCILFVALQQTIRILNKILVPVANIAITLFTIILVSVYAHGGYTAVKGIQFFFEMKLTAFKFKSLWVDCVEKSLESLHMMCGSFIIYGSFAPRQANPVTTTVAVGMIRTIAGLIIVLLYAAVGAVAADTIGAPPECIQNVGWESMGANPAMLMGSFSMPHVWTIMYYLLLYLFDLLYMVLLLFAIVETVLDESPKLREYHVYIVMGLCLFCFLCGLPLTAEAGTHINISLQLYNMNVGTFTLGAYSVIIFWIYGVVRLSDDLYFYTGKQPSRFWTSMWYITPFPIFMVLAPRSIDEMSRHKDGETQILKPLYISIAVLTFSPVVIVMIYQCTVYFKARRLLYVVLPTRDWGPADKEEKRQRLHFNPRKIVRYRIDAPLKNRPAGLISKRQLKIENDRLDAHRKIFLEYINDKEERARLEEEEEKEKEKQEKLKEEKGDEDKKGGGAPEKPPQRLTTV